MSNKLHPALQFLRQLGQQYVFLDTETTGVKDYDLIVQIAVCDQDGNKLLDELVRPALINPDGTTRTMLIPPESTKFHKLTDADVRNAKTFDQIIPLLLAAIGDLPIIIYNAEFDTRLIAQSAAALNLPDPLANRANIHCAMDAYAVHNDEWASWLGKHQPVKLSVAAKRHNIEVVNAHTALGDALMCLGVTKFLMQEYGDPTTPPDGDEPTADEQIFAGLADIDTAPTNHTDDETSLTTTACIIAFDFTPAPSEERAEPAGLMGESNTTQNEPETLTFLKLDGGSTWEHIAFELQGFGINMRLLGKERQWHADFTRENAINIRDMLTAAIQKLDTQLSGIS